MPNTGRAIAARDKLVDTSPSTRRSGRLNVAGNGHRRLLIRVAGIPNQ